jgi:DNA-binding MarR family transcriptional regulator
MSVTSTTTPTTTTGIDVARFRLAIVRLARKQRQQAGTGLTLSLQSALAVIDVRGSLTLGALAAIEQIAPPTITRIVSKLEDLGLVARTADPDDGRVTRVVVTAEGHEQLVESRERRDVWLRQRFDDLDPEDLAALVAALVPLEHLLEVTERAGLDG